MGRTSRVYDESGYVHIVIRGNDQQAIFLDDMDRRKMQKEMHKYSRELSIKIIAYCLMDNHVHLILHDDNLQFSEYMKKVEIAYAKYFNIKYEHSGHLFQDRFYCTPITNDSQLLCAVRYVHLNPWKAHMCTPEQYIWSSYNEYIHGQTHCNTTAVLDMLGNIYEFKKFHLEEDSYFYEGPSNSIKDSEAKAIIFNITGLDNPTNIKNLSKEDRDSMLSNMKAQGLGVRQISRLTGISRGVVQRS